MVVKTMWLVFGLMVTHSNVFTEVAHFPKNSESILLLKKTEFITSAKSIGLISHTENQSTGLPKFLVFNPDLSGQSFVSEVPSVNAVQFLTKYGSYLGLTQISDVKLMLNQSDYAGRTIVQFQQNINGVPIFGGSVKFLFDKSGHLFSVNNDIVPVSKLNTAPVLSNEEASRIAVGLVAENVNSKMSMAKVHSDSAKLYIYKDGLIQGTTGSVHLVYEVAVTDHRSIGEKVYVDAHTGQIVNRVSTIHTAMNRQVSEKSLGNIVWKEGDVFPTANMDWNNEADGSKESYNLFASMAGRDSFDGLGATMKVVNNDPQIQCPNANWNGTSTNYCTGVTADDVVSHEWGHAFTEKTNGLVYQWEPGALNESYSDIWGEVVDMMNGRGLDSPADSRTAYGCSSFGEGGAQDTSYRWLVGEDATAFDGAIRDMWNPNCYGHPAKVSDGAYYCRTTDAGGVHSNSGVNNHAFALMVDGGVFNAVEVSGLGLTKAAHIFWGAQNMLNPTSGHAEQAAALLTSCRTLVGHDLNTLSIADPSTGIPSGEIVSDEDCANVEKVVLAVELNNKPLQCQFKPMLKSNPPALCLNQGNGTPRIINSTDWENGLGEWTVGRRAVKNEATFDALDWRISSALPDGRVGAGVFGANDPSHGNCSDDIEAGVIYIESPAYTADADVKNARVSFDHWVATEAGWDGGNLKISVNGGAWVQIKRTDFGFNPYNSALSSAFSGNNNPNAGQPAFTGTDGGEVRGSWGQSQLSLKNYVVPGASFKLRFEMGLDDCGGMIGWYVDDFKLYACGAEQ